DRLCMGVALPEPQSVARYVELRGLTANVFRFERRKLDKHACGKGREDHDGEYSQPRRNDEWRRQQIPRRNAGRADGEELVAARQADKREYSAEQDRERHELEPETGQLQKAHAKHDLGGDVL